MRKKLYYIAVLLGIASSAFSEEQQGSNYSFEMNSDAPIKLSEPYAPAPPGTKYIVKDAVIETFYGPPPPPEWMVKKEQAKLEAEKQKLGEIEQPEEEPVDPSTLYRLKIGDKLSISIYGEPDSVREVTVDSAGNIYYLYVNSVFVLGKTINELRKELNEKVKIFFKHALVSVTAVSVGGEYYTILGEVKEPGQKVLHGKETLLMAIGEAQGFVRGVFRNETIDYADLDKSFITRKGEYLPINFQKLVKDGDLRQNIELQSGDYIYIPTIMTKDIFILGEVGTVTTLAYLDTVTLIQALTEAGWVSPFASSRVLVLRGSLSCPTQYLVDINMILRHCCPDFELEPGDIVYVPPRKFSHLRAIVRNAIATFVGTVASLAGTRTFISLNPGAAGVVSSPVNVIGGGGVIISPGVVGGSVIAQ